MKNNIYEKFKYDNYLIKLGFWLFLSILSIGISGQAFAQAAHIIDVKILKVANETLTAEVEYSYDGSQGAMIMTGIAKSSKKYAQSTHAANMPAPSGQNQKIKVIVFRPHQNTEISTDLLEISLQAEGQKPILTQVFNHDVNWPEKDANAGYGASEKQSHQHLLAQAIDMIDGIGHYGSNDLAVAKRYLDKIILEDPNNVQTYLELARIAMKNDSDATESSRYAGLDEALRLIKVALKLNPNYANSYILFGYVLAVQNKTNEAIIAFEKAEKIGTSNLWLQHNWALALQNANRMGEAIKKYEEGIKLAPSLMNKPELKSSNRAVSKMYYEFSSVPTFSREAIVS